MVVLTAVTAALYATVYIVLSPFSIDLVPGVLSFSIRTVFPMIFGILFGPAAAFGLGIGNLIGDLFTGSLAFGSLFGFAANFLLGYLGFTLWARFGPRSTETAGTSRQGRVRAVATYLVIGVIAAAAAAVTLAWGLDLLGLAPFHIVAVTLAANFVIGNWTGGLLYLLLHRRVRAMGMTWDEIMDPDPSPPRGTRALLGPLLVTIGGVAGWPVGMALARTGALTATVGAAFAVILLGSFLL